MLVSSSALGKGISGGITLLLHQTVNVMLLCHSRCDIVLLTGPQREYVHISRVERPDIDPVQVFYRQVITCFYIKINLFSYFMYQKVVYVSSEA